MTKPLKVIIIDDEKAIIEATAEALQRAGYECIEADSAQSGMNTITDRRPDIVITDLVLKDGDGMDVLRHAKQTIPDCEVIVITGFASVESAVQAMQQGALHYLRKPLNLDELRTVVARAAERQKLARDNVSLHAQLDQRFGLHEIIGNSPAIRHIFEALRHISPTNATVLITGESGTGKELVAHAIHNNSHRKRGPFVALNCATLPEGVLESELFGHEKGAFTGAIATRKGRFEFADGGTLFLDEIGELSPTTQAKLLRVIEERKIMRIGSNETIDVDVRLIAATNRNLEKMVGEGCFRDDLFYRLKVVSVHMPPLRERAEDIPLLIDAFLKDLSEEYGKKIELIEPEALAALEDFHWAGNVRELRNCLESMVVMNATGKISLADIPANIRNTNTETTREPNDLSLVNSEQRLISAALERADGNREKAARLLGISLRTLYRKLKNLDPTQ